MLEICAREGIAVVPFGGGTSVVGGVEPFAGGFDRLISLDLRRLREVERRSALADRDARRRACAGPRPRRRSRRRG